MLCLRAQLELAPDSSPAFATPMTGTSSAPWRTIACRAGRFSCKPDRRSHRRTPGHRRGSNDRVGASIWGSGKLYSYRRNRKRLTFVLSRRWARKRKAHLYPCRGRDRGFYAVANWGLLIGPVELNLLSGRAFRHRSRSCFCCSRASFCCSISACTP